MFWMWDRKERVESRMTPRLRTLGDGEMEQPSTTRARSSNPLSSAAGATTMSSVLLRFSWSKFVGIHDFSF